jgi:geranylgeranyl diphosphate synthase, type I
MFGDPGTMGKPSDGDLREGKYTFLIHHALSATSAASPAERQEIRSALGDRALPADAVARVLRILEATGARRAVVRMIEERLAAAREALDGLHLEADGRTFLAGLIDDLREREH